MLTVFPFSVAWPTNTELPGGAYHDANAEPKMGDDIKVVRITTTPNRDRIAVVVIVTLFLFIVLFMVFTGSLVRIESNDLR